MKTFTLRVPQHPLRTAVYRVFQKIEHDTLFLLEQKRGAMIVSANLKINEFCARKYKNVC